MSKNIHTRNWEIYHSTSEMYAGLAEAAATKGEDASAHYRKAAENETLAWLELDVFNAFDHSPRTVGIIAVSAVSLWVKAGDLRKAKNVATVCLNNALPEFAERQLRELMQVIEVAINELPAV